MNTDIITTFCAFLAFRVKELQEQKKIASMRILMNEYGVTGIPCSSDAKVMPALL